LSRIKKRPGARTHLCQKFTMTIETNKLLQALQQATADISRSVQALQQLPAELQVYRPAPAQWNMRECIAHLNRYGDHYLPLMEAAVRNSSFAPDPVFNSGWIGNRLVRMIAPEPGGKPLKKMKTPRTMNPLNTLTDAGVWAHFEQQQRRLMTLLQQPAGMNLNLIRIPVAILPLLHIRLGDLLRFMVAHNQRHLLQAQTLYTAQAGAGNGHVAELRSIFAVKETI
jgi:hypothetical protein